MDPPQPDPSASQQFSDKQTDSPAGQELSNKELNPPGPFTDEQLANELDTVFNIFAFERLRWLVFRPISAMQVLDDAGDETSTLRPFDGHPIASTMATLTSCSTMQVSIDCLANREAEDENDEGCKFRAPEPLVIRNPGGITVGDFIAAVHPYLQTHKEEIINCDDSSWGYSPPELQYYYMGGIDSPRDDPDVYICLYFGWEEANEYWDRQAKMVQRRRESGFALDYADDSTAYLDAEGSTAYLEALNAAEPPDYRLGSL